ncbi:MAG: hypothetical protein ACK44N_12720 [Bacteroidota bacterium]
MNRLFLIAIIFLFANNCSAQQWTAQEFESANTAKDIQLLTDEEKEVVRYINLARLYPKKFASIELKKAIEDGLYKETEFTKSLQVTLNQMKPVGLLSFDQTMYQLANCFAIESGKSGSYGHHRVHCVDGYDAECCSYGTYDYIGRYVAIQLLIDEGVPSLGHRKACLDKSMEKVGLNIQPHASYDYCCVLDFKGEETIYKSKKTKRSLRSKLGDIFR